MKLLITDTFLKFYGIHILKFRFENKNIIKLLQRELKLYISEYK